MICRLCKGENIVKNESFYVCINCGCVLSYLYLWCYDIENETIQKIFYKRITYLLFLINNINHKFINYDCNLLYRYNDIEKKIIFSYWENKRYIKENKLNIPYHNIYFFMYKKFKNEYLFINENIKSNIINLFLKYENIYKDIKKHIHLKKKFLNYHFVLYKIFWLLNLNEIYFNYLELPKKLLLIEKLNNIWDKFFI